MQIEIVPLTQGHLEAYQDALRVHLRAVNAAWQAEVEIASAAVEARLRLAPPATHAYPFYQKFLDLFREKANTDGATNLSRPEQYGLMTRAAILSGWLLDVPWKPEEVPTLPAKLVTWLGHKLDATYSDYDFAVETAQVKAALDAGWFENLAVLPEEPSDIEALAKQAQKAYREATELPPE